MIPVTNLGQWHATEAKEYLFSLLIHHIHLYPGYILGISTSSNFPVSLPDNNISLDWYLSLSIFHFKFIILCMTLQFPFFFTFFFFTLQFPKPPPSCTLCLDLPSFRWWWTPFRCSSLPLCAWYYVAFSH